jgi:NAD(P)H dehydrogenase (quinone)
VERIAVTGANGEFGRAVAEELLRRVDPASIVATVREPDRANALAERGVTVRGATFDDGDGLAEALAGATTVLVNATFFGVEPQRRGVRVATAIRAATAAEASRIVVTSWPEADSCPVEMTRDYPEIERMVRAAGPEWTILRLGYGIADSIARDVIWALRSGELAAPAGDARCAPAAVGDLAEATALALLDRRRGGHRYELTGPRAVSWAELAGLASLIAGRPIAYRPVEDEQFRALLDDLGLPERAAAGLLDYYAAFRGGWGNRAHPDLEALLGRPAVDSLEAVRQRVPGHLTDV